MKQIVEFNRLPRILLLLSFFIVYVQPVYAWKSKDRSVTIHGFIDNTTHKRFDYGLSKQRTRGQLELSKYFKPQGIFSEISLHGTLRATYDGVYDINDDDFGDKAGGGVTAESTGIPTPIGPLSTPWGFSPVTAGNPLLPGGGGFGFNLAANPGTGLKRVGSELGERSNNGAFGGGLEFFTPVRPCNVDPRGCIDGYMDDDMDELRFAEFNDDLDWLRELYLDLTIPFDNGQEINMRIGRQQVVWGRTDLFRVLDQVNPIDFSIQNIFEEFEDSRIPTGIFSAEYRLGTTDIFDDLNFQFLWMFEEFRPHNLGQGGQPYNALLVGDAFRALNNCWHNGCTVSNFAAGLSPAGNLATDFAPHTLGIRQAVIPDNRRQFGFRIEGVYKGVGFSANALSFYQQLPSLRAGIASINPFIATGVPGNPFDPTDVGGVERPRPFVPAFDIHFPRVSMIGGSTDFYVDPIKSAFRVELAWTTGEEFVDTSKPRLFSESDVVRWVVGWDRQTFIRFLNPRRAFLLSAQVFGQHLVDYESFTSPFGGQYGFQDHKDNYFLTFLFQGNYKNDQVSPQVLTAYDVGAQALVVGPSVNWLINNNWRVTLGANLKFGISRRESDSGNSSNSFPPFSAGAGCPLPPPGPPGPACFPGNETASLGIFRGFEPLGRFKSGPLGMSQHEDEIQLTVRYRF